MNERDDKTYVLLKHACSSRTTPKPRPPTPTPRPNITFHTYKCPPAYAAWYCLNDATCFTVKIGDSLLYNCECADGYMGPRCEYKDLDGSYLPTRPRVMLETASIASGATLALFLVLILCLVFYVRWHQAHKKDRLAREENGNGVDTVDGLHTLNQLYAGVFNALCITNSNQLHQFDRLGDLSVCLKEKREKKMNFPFVVVAIILVCLTITCNGQFKILGLLDTKSELNNGNAENIRSLIDDVGEPLSVKVSDLETIKESESVDDSAKGNVNFIKPLEPSVAERKSEIVESTSVAASTTRSIKTKETFGTDETNSENVFDEDVDDEPSFSGIVAPIRESSTARTTTTIATKNYRKTIRPNIRKFSYIEARSFHHPDSPNHVTPRNDYKYVKVVKYRNKYKSRCRCERIWNCPKIQISIQRCEPDYFMCCF
ncbi:hypothetical protein HA402_015536 [Bradysia odoriphaga]|nr:hypothetical protein HA402_015536 [Bradysia odoriphaga]